MLCTSDCCEEFKIREVVMITNDKRQDRAKGVDDAEARMSGVRQI